VTADIDGKPRVIEPGRLQGRAHARRSVGHPAAGWTARLGIYTARLGGYAHEDRDRATTDEERAYWDSFIEMREQNAQNTRRAKE